MSYQINLQFTDFNLPSYGTNNCDDTLEIRYYHLGRFEWFLRVDLWLFFCSFISGQVGPTYCGSGANSNNLQFRSAENNLMIVFQSNRYYAGRGFRAQATLAQ